MVLQLPPGWPPEVRPPDSDAFESSAVEWMLSILPPGYREHARAHRYPVGLALIARHHAQACLNGARQGYRVIRAELGGQMPPGEIDVVLAAYRDSGARMAATARSAVLVETALREKGWTPWR